jgi:2-hydroxychromene-2-carboxylate isomerase
VSTSPVSSADCIRALVRVGFRPVDSFAAPAILERGLRAVMVPDVPTIDPETLRVILMAAGLSDARFRELVGSRRASSPFLEEP